MRIAVLGTGPAGRTVASGLARLGHEVVVGTRDPVATGARDDWDLDLPLQEFAHAVDGADLVVNLTNGNQSIAALEAVGDDLLAGKVILDAANELDHSRGFPPAIGASDTRSLAEDIQRRFPDARVVKAMNTMNARVMVAPAGLGDGDTTIFAASDDAAARALVVTLLEDLGWRDVVEFDQLSAARGLETWMALWVRLMGALGTVDFNLKLVR